MRPDFDHFNKFKVSIGIWCIGASILLPWLILREQAVLLVSSAELDGLTATARGAITARQTHYSWLVRLYPVASLVLLVLGIWQMTAGMKAWKKLQEDLDWERAFPFRQMTDAEASAKAESEADFLLGMEESPFESFTQGGASLASRLPPDVSTTEVRDGQDQLNDLFEQSRSNWVERLQQDEAVAAAALERAFSATHDVMRNVRLSPASTLGNQHTSRARGRELDALLHSRNLKQSPNWLVEIKRLRVPFNYQTIIQSGIDQLGMTLYSLQTEGFDPNEFAGLLVCMYDVAVATHGGAGPDELLDALLRGMSSVLHLNVAAMAIPFDQLTEIDGEELRAFVKPGLATVWNELGVAQSRSVRD